MTFVRMITPKRRSLMNESIFINRLTRYMRDVRDDTRRLMAEPTRTWKGKPEFRTYLIVTTKGANLKVMAVGKNASKYKWIDEGTRPHVIRAKNHPTLYFKTEYNPATTPNQLTSTNASRGGDFIDPISVNHPGIRKRGFIKQVMVLMKPAFKKACEQAIRDAIRLR